MMLKILILLIFSSGCCFGVTNFSKHDDRTAKELILGRNTNSWKDLLEGGKEPESLLESVILGAKVGLFIVSPISAAVSFASDYSMSNAAGSYAKSLVGSVVFVNSFWVLGEVLKKLGIYHGLEPDLKKPTQDEVTGTMVTPNKYSTHYSCVIRTLYFGRNGC
ncbi:MAG: hypothetical protein HRU09_16545, partial [Oligoflexales bacterium]|nr:hypothetical protein [Oligoflexales bacterium]